MNKHLLKLAVLLIAIFAATTLAKATSDGALSITRLHPAFAENNRVHSYQLSPDEETVVYYAGDFSKNNYSLQAVPRRAGSDPLTISRPEDAGRIAQYAITPDSRTAIYNNRAALVAVALDGADAHTITLPLSQTTDQVTESVSNFWIAPDQQTIVYHISTYPLVYERLMRVNLDGSAATELVTKPGMIWVEHLTAERVVYRSTQPSQHFPVMRLFSLPLQGGQPVAMTSGLSINQFVDELSQLSPDGQTVVFKVSDMSNQALTALYEASVDGTDLVRLSDPAHTQVRYMLISPDSQSIVYGNLATFEIGGIDAADLYRVARGGGPAVRLNGAAQPSSFQNSYTLAITPDSQRVVFAGKDWPNAGGYQIFSVPITGGTPAPLSDQAHYFAFVIAQHGQSVVYARTGPDTTRNQLYRVSIDGGPATLLSGALGDECSMDRMQVIDGGHSLITIQRGAARHTAYAFDLRDGTSTVLNPEPYADMYFDWENPYTVTANGDVISLAEVIGSPAQEELFVTTRPVADQSHVLFVPLVQR